MPRPSLPSIHGKSSADTLPTQRETNPLLLRSARLASVNQYIKDEIPTWIRDLILVEYAQAKLNQVLLTKQYSSSFDYNLAKLSNSILVDTVNIELGHLIKSSIHRFVLCKLHHDKLVHLSHAMIQDLLKSWIQVEIDEATAANQQHMHSNSLIESPQNNTDQESAHLLNAMVLDELCSHRLHPPADPISIQPVLLAYVLEHLLSNYQ